MNVVRKTGFGTSCAIVALLVTLMLAPTAEAQKLTPTELDTADAQGYLGEWTLSMTLLDNPTEVSMQLLDVGGKVAGLLVTSFDPAPSVFQKMNMSDSGLFVEFELAVGPMSFTININAALDGDSLTGTFGDTGGLASAEFTGKRGGPDLQALLSEESEAGQSRRRGYGSEVEKNIDGHKLKIRFLPMSTDSPDFKSYESLAAGDVFKFVAGRATKMMTDADLVFGKTVIKTENASPGYPGVYSVWLKKTKSGWNLVFNEDSDIWGSQHLTSADVAEVPLKVAALDEPQEDFTLEIIEEGAGGMLRLAWDTTEWTAPFTLGENAIERAQTAAAPKASSGAGDVSALVGTWNLKGESQFGELEHTLIVAADGTAEYLSSGDSSEVTNLSVENGKITFDMTVFAGAGQSYDVAFEGAITDEGLTGDIMANGSSFTTLAAPRS